MQLDTCGLIGLCCNSFSVVMVFAVQLVDSFHCSVFEMVLQRVVRVLNVVVSNLN